MADRNQLMLRCLELAEKGRGHVSPNPMVGCVIVKDGEIIGEGYHHEFGGPHAEVNAIASATAPVEGAEVFVNLEPCSYFGKTPPCVDLLIEKRVKKVYAAMLDPNPHVNGTGVKRLREAGIDVEIGLLEEDSRKLNEKFIKFMSKGLPFVTLKIAQSLDGKIALPNGISKYITSRASLNEVHSLRSEYDAVLVGAGTVRFDDPELTVRSVPGKSPVKVILDGSVSSSIDSRVFDTRPSRTIFIYNARVEENSLSARRKISTLRNKGVECVGLKSPVGEPIQLRRILKKLAEMNMSSILVEGGSGVFSQFIKTKTADKVHVFIAPKIMGAGKSFADGFSLNNLSGAIPLKNLEVSRLGEDCMVTGYFRFSSKKSGED